jgi:hypothetical protein
MSLSAATLQVGTHAVAGSMPGSSAHLDLLLAEAQPLCQCLAVLQTRVGVDCRQSGGRAGGRWVRCCVCPAASVPVCLGAGTHVCLWRAPSRDNAVIRTGIRSFQHLLLHGRFGKACTTLATAITTIAAVSAIAAAVGTWRQFAAITGLQSIG